MMKLVLISALIAVASAAFPLQRQLPVRPLTLPTPSYNPQPSQGRQIAILRSESEAAPDGSSYQYAYDTENGISAQESGSLVGSGADVALAARGAFSWTSPEGIPVQIQYIADENGYQPSGDALPTPPPTQPIPLAIARALEYIAAHPQPQTPSGPFVRKY